MDSFTYPAGFNLIDSTPELEFLILEDADMLLRL